MEEVFKAQFDDSEIIAKLERLEKQILEIGQSVDKTGDMAAQSLNQASGAAASFEQSIDRAAQQTAKQAKAVEQARAANQTWLQSVRQTIAGQQIAGRSLGEWAEQARGFADRINAGSKATGSLSGAWRIFNGILKASGIGLLVGIIASVISYFTKFQSGIDKVSQVMSSLNAITNVLIERFLKLGSGILKLFSRDFVGGAQEITAAFSGLGDELANAAVEAFNLEKRLQALRDVTITQSVEAARARVELSQLRDIVNDGTRSINERSRAAREAANIEKELASQAVDRALEAQQIAQRQFALDKESLAAREAAAKAEIEFQEAVLNLNSVVADAEKEQREFRKEAAEERRKQQEEELKKAEQLRKEYDKLFADIQRQAEALNIENTFNPVERVIKQYQAALDETKRLREQLLILAPTEAEKQRVNDAIETLLDEITIKYREELNKAEDELNDLKGGKIREALNPLPPLQTLRRDVTDVLRQLNQAANEFIEGQQPRSLAEILGISQDSLEGLKDATAQIIDGLNQIAEARLREAEAATRAAEEKVSAAEEALEKERELARQGFANDSDLRKQELEKAKEQREEALKEQAKAARAQILLDSAQQVSGLATSSVNIFKSLSGLGPVGIGIAIATIATMFAAFAKAKSDAFKAAAVPKLRKGGKIQGRTHEQGGEMAATPEGDVFELERDEWVIATEHSREQDKFLARLNKGEFKGIDLNEMLSKPGASNPLPAAAARVRQIEQERREIEDAQNFRAMQAAYEKSADRIVKAIEEKPEIAPYKSGYRRFVKKGNVTEVTTVTPD